MRIETRLCVNYFCESRANSKINSVKIFQKLIFAIINYLFSHLMLFFFISIELINISRLKFGLDSFNISETKRFKQYEEIKLALNKISSIKS